MKNKITKFVTILSIIFISFFISQNKADAKEFYSCDYTAPMSYINENNIPTLFRVSGTFDTPYKRGGTNIIPGTIFAFGPTNFNEQSVDAFCLTKSDGKYYLSLKLSPGLEYNSDYANVSQKIIAIDYAIESISGNYVKIYFDGNTLKSSSANEESYKKYLNGNQYLNSGISSSLYNFIAIDNLKSEKYFQGQYKCQAKCDMQGVGEFNKNDTLKNFIKNTGGIVFVNSNLSENYPNKNLSLFKQMTLTAKDEKGNSLSEEERNQAVEGLGVLVDTNTKNGVTYTKAFYDGTNILWSKYMNATHTDNADEIRRNYFSKWFDKSIARYVFENDLDKFLKYFKYIYKDECGTSYCDLNNDGVHNDKDKKIYTNIITIITKMQTYTGESDCKKRAEKDPCITICGAGGSTSCPNETVVTNCQSSQAYKTCQTCTNRCKNIQSASGQTACYDGCTNNNYSATIANAEKNQKDASNDLVDAALTLYGLNKVKAPDLDINFKPYEVTCDDVAIFHTFYVILQIMAPILVILFGTIDYAKAVMASDVEKMQKAKKNFPKRLGLLLLFIFVPLLVSFLIGEFSSTNSSLMYCIINGG